MTEEEIKKYRKSIAFTDYIRHKALEYYNFKRRMLHFERYHHNAATCLELEYPEFPDAHIKFLKWKLGEDID